MKRYANLFVFVALILSGAVIAQENQSKFPAAAKAVKEDAKPRTVTIPADNTAANVYSQAQQRTIEALTALRNSKEFKDYLIAQNQEQTAMVALMGELGIKPFSDGCRPVYLKDGKTTLADGTPVTPENGKLDHFECSGKSK